MRMRVSNLLESKKFIITVIIANCIILISMVGYLLIIRTHFKTDIGQRETASKNETVEYTESDSDLINIYSSLLEGCDFNLGKNIHFVFGTNGSYSGFFDTKEVKVSDYLYKVLVDDDNIKLHIYNKEETKMISYYMAFDKNGNILLKRPNTKKAIKLKF